MHRTAVRLTAAIVLAASAGLAAAQAPAPTATRTILQRTDASPDQEVIVAQVDTPAGAALMRHRHPGVEIGYVVSGQVELIVEGQAHTYKTGESFLVPRGAVHAGHPVGDGPARTVSTYVVDKGKPLVEVVP